jgi:hypothetical protein
MYAYDSFEKANKRLFAKSLKKYSNETPMAMSITDTGVLSNFYSATTALENDLNKIISDTAYSSLKGVYATPTEPKVREVLPNIRNAMMSLGKINITSLPDIEVNQLTQIKDILDKLVEALVNELNNLQTSGRRNEYILYKKGIDTFMNELMRLTFSLNALLVSSSRMTLTGSGLPRRFM